MNLDHTFADAVELPVSIEGEYVSFVTGSPHSLVDAFELKTSGEHHFTPWRSQEKYTRSGNVLKGRMNGNVQADGTVVWGLGFSRLTSQPCEDTSMASL